MTLTARDKRQILRIHLWSILHEGRGRLGHAFNFFLVVLILLSVAIVPLRFFPSDPGFNTFINILEAFIVGVFTLEYLLRLYCAPHRLKYAFSFFGIVDFLSIMPFYTGIFHTEYIRALRLIRLFKLGDVKTPGEADEEMTGEGIGLVEGEHVEFIVTKHPLFLILGCVPPAVALSFGFAILLVTEGNTIGISGGIALILFALLLLWKTWQDYSHDVIYITNRRLIFHNKHLLGHSINQVSYHAITNVKPYYPSILAYIFRYGSLIIDTAAASAEISVTMVRNHEKAGHLIMQKSFAGNRESNQ